MMDTVELPSIEESLDPDDWDEFRRFAHRAMDDMISYLEEVRERPVWQPLPDSVKQSFERPVPVEGEGVESAYSDFTTSVLPYPYGNIHPRFWGWVNGTGTPLAMVAEMLAATMNPNVSAFEQAANSVERQVIRWMVELMGLPATASGLLTSGGSVANLVGLAVARNAKAGFDVRREGLQGEHPDLVVYASVAAHNSVQKGVELLGLGERSLQRIPVQDDFTIDLERLETSILSDRAAGRSPVCVVANAGTVDTGAIDNLERISEICRREEIWLHVDGAFGALAALSDRHRPLLRGLERADSLALDLHKWLYMPFEAGCVLVREAEQHQATFSASAPYLMAIPGSVSGGGFNFKDHGLQLSRQFRALKVWLSLKAEGVKKFGRLIEQNVAQASYLAHRVEDHEELELMAPVPLNVICFRYRPQRHGDLDLEAINLEILIELHRSGVAVPNSTLIRQEFAIRVAITNHRTRREDLDLLVSEVVRLGREKVAGRGVYSNGIAKRSSDDSPPESKSCQEVL